MKPIAINLDDMNRAQRRALKRAGLRVYRRRTRYWRRVWRGVMTQWQVEKITEQLQREGWIVGR